MHSRSGDSMVLQCHGHRRSRSRKAEIQSFRRELARLDHIQDHVLEVVTDRLLDALGIVAPEPAPFVTRDEATATVQVRISLDCVERSVGSLRVPATNM